jgi:hypothetical protein
MHSHDPERPTTKARAIEKALGLIGEPITEAQAKDIAALEDCDCKGRGRSARTPPRDNACLLRQPCLCSAS